MIRDALPSSQFQVVIFKGSALSTERGSVRLCHSLMESLHVGVFNV